MSPNSPAAWGMSFALHALVLGIIALFAYTSRLSEDKPRPIIELVMGPGEDYGAKAAPALGSEVGVKLDLSQMAPAPVETAPAPPAPTPPAPAPRVEEKTPVITPAPKAPPVKKAAPKTPPKTKTPDPAKNMAKEIKSNVRAADSWARKEAVKERKKEEARIAKITKEQFDKMQASKRVASATSPKGTATKVPKIDAKGIARGVVGGSSESKAGAGGRALERVDGSVLELYDAELLLKLRREFEADRPPGLSDSLKVTIAVRSNPDGSLTGAKIVDDSGNAEFDRAVLEALKRVRMPSRPDKKADYLSFVFTMRED